MDFENENCDYKWKIPSFAPETSNNSAVTQTVLTLCFNRTNQVLLFLPKRSAKYVIATVPKQLVPERIRIAQPLSNLACTLEDPSSLFIGDLRQRLLKGLLR